MKYLGLPLGPSFKPTSIWSNIVIKIRKVFGYLEEVVFVEGK
jgi:hypothetical protein